MLYLQDAYGLRWPMSCYLTGYKTHLESEAIVEDNMYYVSLQYINTHWWNSFASHAKSTKKQSFSLKGE